MISLFSLLTCLILTAALILQRLRRTGHDPLPPEPTAHPRLALLVENEKSLSIGMDRESGDAFLTLVA